MHFTQHTRGISIEAYLGEAMWDHIDPDLPDAEAEEEQIDHVVQANNIYEHPQTRFDRIAINDKSKMIEPVHEDF